MPNSELPQEIVDFIARYIKSLEHLEVLLLVSGTGGKDWTCSAVYEVIKSNESSIDGRLKDLSRQGLLTQGPGSEPVYRFEPADDKVPGVIETLATIYRERRLRVVEAIYSSSGSQIPGLADAFTLKKGLSGFRLVALAILMTAS